MRADENQRPGRVPDLSRLKDVDETATLANVFIRIAGFSVRRRDARR